MLCWLPLFVVRIVVIATYLVYRVIKQLAALGHERELRDHLYVTTMMATHETKTNSSRRRETETNQISLDTDSCEMRVDTGASHCISYERCDFVGKLTPTRGSIQGYHEVNNPGRLHMGTMKFSLTDDEGMPHTFTVPNCIYDNQGRHKLL